MIPRQASLEQIQRWMQSVIMHPGGVAEGLDAPESRAHLPVAADELESVISRSRALDSAERLEIYVNAYHERLLECLREEFVATREALGGELFEAMAFGYLQQYPSRSYTLNALGARFPAFLAESRLHAHAAPADVGPTWPDFVIEVARFERLQRDVFDGPGSEGQGGLDVEQLAAIPAEAWGGLCFQAVPCLRLGRFEHPVHDYWEELKNGGQPPAPAPRDTCLAIHRRAYVVERHELSSAEHRLLERIVAGHSLQEALAQMESPVEEWQLIEERLQAWFARWTSLGFFTAVS